MMQHVTDDPDGFVCVFATPARLIARVSPPAPPNAGMLRRNTATARCACGGQFHDYPPSCVNVTDPSRPAGGEPSHGGERVPFLA